MIRQWSDHVFAPYVEDGLFGRRVGLAQTREEAEILAAQAVCDDERASNSGTIGAPGGSAQTLGPPDDLTPLRAVEPVMDGTRTPRQTRVTHPTVGG